ncbi:MAG: acyl-CoA/acyl-ACP dehydrogenase [Deltaproteobacteria bacterium]|nr:acyl-CoA/acyl-ACP dehydrogenase [Deltaproteobacteria bacterium]
MNDFSFGLTDEQRTIRETCERMLRPFEARRREFERAVREQGRIPEEFWSAMVEVGLLGAFIPEEYGGTAMGLTALATASDVMAAKGFGHPLYLLTGMDALCIARAGSEETKRKFLPAIAGGRAKLAFAITEAGAGTNSFRMTTRARREGDHWVIDGEKTFITAIDESDYVMLVARTRSRQELEEAGLPKTACLSVFVVDSRAPGVSLTPLPIRAIEGARQWTVHLDGVRVPAENLVGPEHAGGAVMFATLNPERVLVAAGACGQTQHLIEMSVGYARERVVFGTKPIGAYQAVQHPLADLRIRLEAARGLTYKAAAAYDGGIDPAETGAYANMAKYLAADLAVDAADRAIQTHGGSGFSEDVGVISYWERTRLMRTAPISREMILNYVGEHLLGLPRSY